MSAWLRAKGRKNIDETSHIKIGIKRGLIHARSDRHLRGGMNYELRRELLYELTCLSGANIGNVELNACRMSEVSLRTTRKVIDNVYLMPSRKKLINDVRSDEPGAARNNNLCHIYPFLLRELSR
jgi:hypothetical protein